MSNGYKDYISDLRTQFDINTRAFNYLPEGWVKSFVPQMKEELFYELGGYSDDFEVVDAKEKWAALRVYWCWKDRDYEQDEIEDLNYLTNAVEEIIHKYSEVSFKTCMICGEDASGYTLGYVTPVCEKCNTV